jgi:hypothetical protein
MRIYETDGNEKLRPVNFQRHTGKKLRPRLVVNYEGDSGNQQLYLADASCPVYNISDICATQMETISQQLQVSTSDQLHNAEDKWGQDLITP